MRKAICWWIPIMYLLISDMFYLRTYDSAQVKITLLQMGGGSLLGLWASLLILEGKKAFRKADLLILSPFIAYLVYSWMSFIHAPYPGPSVDDLVRYTLYMSVSVIVIREFSKKDIDRLTKILLITGYISILYGFVQFLDTRFFPPKEMGGTGLDPFMWRWAFGKRVFSTYGNPNFFGNFLVLILPIAVAQYLKKKSIILLPLIALDLLCMYATETKGAWLGFAVTFFIFCVFYGYFFLREKLKISKAKFLGIAAIIPVLAFSAVIVYSYLRPTSVSFRVATWLSTWEIAETHPIMGIGTGSFKVIYPAYRRPIIFHIEGRHNTETDHAEEEHLEQFMDHGILGVGIYFWLIFFVTAVGLKSLSVKTSNLSVSEKAPDEAYDILGYLSAFLGMLAHNCTDVSMRFVSSGIFLGLLPGVIVNIARGRGLWELRYIGNEIRDAKENCCGFVRWYDNFLGTLPGKIIMWAVKAAGIFAFIYFACIVFKDFNSIQGDGSLYIASSERLQWQLGWLFLSCTVIAGTAVFICASAKARSLLVPVVLVLSLFPSYYFWGWFRADAAHNLAIFMSKQGKWTEAVEYYLKVSADNEYFIMPYYFIGNVFNDRFNMKQEYHPELGDKDFEPRTDFDRAMDAYNKVASMAPNYVQMHHQKGVLYLKLHDYYTSQGKLEEAAEATKSAMRSFDMYEKLDPVFANNYYRKAQVYMSHKEYDKAIKEYEHYIFAWKCFQKDHKHESADAYLNYGNALFLAQRYKEAADSYRKALEFDPNSEYAQHNLKVAERNFVTFDYHKE